MSVIDGKKIAEDILSELKKLPIPTGRLAAVLSGENQPSLSFLRQKEKVARDLGIQFELRQLSDSLSQKELEYIVRKISKDESVYGVIVQLPLPDKYDKRAVLNSIDAQKDIDALCDMNDDMFPPSVLSLKYILEDIGFIITGKKVVVVGNGFLIGQPIARWLKGGNVEFVILEKDNFDITALKEADLVISGTGQTGLIRGEYLKNGVVIIDYGYGIRNGKVSGDVDFESVKKLASFVTPTPGGTGPIVVASLFVNFYGKRR